MKFGEIQEKKRKEKRTCEGKAPKKSIMLTSAWLMAWLASRMIECSERCASCSSRISHSSTEPSARTGVSSVIDSPVPTLNAQSQVLLSRIPVSSSQHLIRPIPFIRIGYVGYHRGCSIRFYRVGEVGHLRRRRWPRSCRTRGR